MVGQVVDLTERMAAAGVASFRCDSLGLDVTFSEAIIGEKAVERAEAKKPVLDSETASRLREEAAEKAEAERLKRELYSA